jgi:HJR/Mrr/RecB family endonuclease
MMHVVPQDFELERQLEFVEATIARLERQRDEIFEQQRNIAQPTRTARWRRRYYHAAQRFRAPGEQYELWPWGIMLVAPATCAALILIVAHWISDSMLVGLAGFTVTAAVVGIACAALLFRPSPERLAALRRAEDSEQETGASLERALLATTENLRKYVVERDTLRAAAKARRTQLLRRDWRALRDQDWVDYLAEMLLALGAVVQLQRKTAEPGLDLIAEFGPHRVAIQANTSERTIPDSAVRAVMAAQKAHHCHAAAIITNSRFHPSATRLATAQRCLLIGADDFERFALGEIRL